MVCSLVVEGLTSKEIAARLHIAVPTVNKHVMAAMRKLGARNKIQLAALVARGLVPMLGLFNPESACLSPALIAAL